MGLAQLVIYRNYYGNQPAVSLSVDLQSLIHRAPNMDTLVAMGATAAFGYSTYALFAMTACADCTEMDKLVMSYMHEFYFESAAMILTLITLGKTLEAYSKGKTTDALKSLMNLAPKMATVVRNGQETDDFCMNR